MRKTFLTFASIVVVTLAASGAPADVLPQAEEMRTARADEQTLVRPEPVPVVLKSAGQRGAEDLRDSAALVLVGSMLIALAAAVRRTA